MVLLIGNRGQAKRKQGTGETETGDRRNGNRGRAKLEQQTSDRQNSGLSKPNSE